MRSFAKKTTCLILALAMVFAMTPVLSGQVYAQDRLVFPTGEVQASDLEEGQAYTVPSGGTTIVLAAGDDVTIQSIKPGADNSVLTIRGSSAGKLTVTDGIDMQQANNHLIVEGGTLIVDRTSSNSWASAIAASHYTQHGGNVTAKITNNPDDTTPTVGVMANYGFLMDGGLLTASAVSNGGTGFALACEGHGNPQGTFVMNGGTLTASATGRDAVVLRVYEMHVYAGEFIGNADALVSAATGFSYTQFNGNSVDIKGGTVDLNINSAGRATAINTGIINIEGGKLTGTVNAPTGQAYGINNYFDDAAFTVSGGTVDMTASANPGVNEAYPYYLYGVNITGGTIKALSKNGKWGYGMWIRDRDHAAVIKNAILDLKVKDVDIAYGIGSSGDLNIGASTVGIEAIANDNYCAGIYCDSKLTLTESDVDVKTQSANDANGLYLYDDLEMADSIVTVKSDTTGNSGCGAYVANELTMNDSSMTLNVTSGGLSSYGISTNSGAYDWNINYSEIEANVNSTSDGSYTCGGVLIYHDEGESTVNLNNSKIITSCKAPDAYSEGFTSISDLTLSGKSSIEATGEATANAYGIYVRGNLTMNGSHASLYGHGISNPWSGYGIRADGTITLNGKYYVSIPEDGIIEDGIVKHPVTFDVALEAKIEALPVEHLRVKGSSRFDTAIQAAEYMRKSSGWGKFTTVIVADGMKFADALSGSYLAYAAAAPILLVHSSCEDTVANYIKDKTSLGGTVYILGGKSAVSEEFEAMLDGYNVVRLGGKSRYETNVQILQEANSIDGSCKNEVLVCSGTGFADALSTSSVGKPILLVGDSISEEQKQYLTETGVDTAWIIGGTKAVSEDVETELQDYIPASSTSRLRGASRYETSYKVAAEFFPGSYETAVLVYGQNFPDGLSGGAVAANLGAPVLLAMNNDEMNVYAAKWVEDSGAYCSITMGGVKLISDESVLSIMNDVYDMVEVFEA